VESWVSGNEISEEGDGLYAGCAVEMRKWMQVA